MNRFYEIFFSLLLLASSVLAQNEDAENKADPQEPVKVEESSPLDTNVNKSAEVNTSDQQTEKILAPTELNKKLLEEKKAVQNDVPVSELEEVDPKEEVFAQKTSKSLAIYFVLLTALLVGVMLLAWFIPPKSTKAED